MQTLPGHATKTKEANWSAKLSLSRLVPAVNHRPARPDTETHYLLSALWWSLNVFSGSDEG